MPLTRSHATKRTAQPISRIASQGLPIAPPNRPVRLDTRLPDEQELIPTVASPIALQSEGALRKGPFRSSNEFRIKMGRSELPLVCWKQPAQFRRPVRFLCRPLDRRLCEALTGFYGTTRLCLQTAARAGLAIVLRRGVCLSVKGTGQSYKSHWSHKSHS